jgi:hypothetical protein
MSTSPSVNNFIIALDLEGTLVSNAMSQIPRPGLCDFLEFCRRHFSKVVLFTAASRGRAETVLKNLVDAGDVPAWVLTEMDYIEWLGPYKDLVYVKFTDANHVLLVDDNEAYIHPDQKDRWIQIEEYASPYPADDKALEKCKGDITRKLESSCGRQ